MPTPTANRRPLLVRGGRTTPDTLLCVDGRIAEAAPALSDVPAREAATLDAAGCLILPGLIDVHVHGAMGGDVMDADPAVLGHMARFFAHHGVTAFLPTTMTADHAATLAAVQAVAAAYDAPGGQPHPNGAAILGVHLEGPYISPQFPGAQPAAAIRPPDLEEFAAYCAAGPVRMITLAPEVPGAHELIRAAAARNIIAVAGHTAATYDECEAGIAAGIRQATHTYNAMTGLHHRNPGTLGSVLTNDAVYAQLIADTIHVHPAAMQILARCKGVERTLLITDAIRAAGLSPGEYELGGQSVSVRNNECRLADGTLAGSVLTLERGVAHFAAAAQLPLARAWQAGAATPAAALGLSAERGDLLPGKRADLVLVEERSEGETGAEGCAEVVATVIGGRVVYLRDAERLRGNRGEHDPDGPGSL